jgi:hypothetical protein
LHVLGSGKVAVPDGEVVAVADAVLELLEEYVAVAVREGLAPYVKLLVGERVGTTFHASTTRPGLPGAPAVPP